MMMHMSTSVLKHSRDFHPDQDLNHLLFVAPRFAFSQLNNVPFFSRFNVIIIYLKPFLYHKSKLSNMEQEVSKDDFNS